jgi:regulator of extracellular matrix RemA (YlzA/DUF370 family)
MSKTYRKKYPDWRIDTITIPYVNIDGKNRSFSISTPTSKPKKRKEVDTKDYWMTTPSWYRRMYHTRPRRQKSRIWSITAKNTVIEDLDLLDKPNYSNKPHWYYW